MKLSINGAIFAIISTIVGCGIVGLPYCFLHLGFILSIFLMIILSFQTYNSTSILLKVKDMLPGKPESLFEIGFWLFKRPSIFFIAAVLVINSLGLVIVYFIVYATTMESIFNDLFGLSGQSYLHFIAMKEFWIVVLALAITPIILKKDIQEMYIISVVLFISL